MAPSSGSYNPRVPGFFCLFQVPCQFVSLELSFCFEKNLAWNFSLVHEMKVKGLKPSVTLQKWEISTFYAIFSGCSRMDINILVFTRSKGSTSWLPNIKKEYKEGRGKLHFLQSKHYHTMEEWTEIFFFESSLGHLRRDLAKSCRCNDDATAFFNPSRRSDPSFIQEIFGLETEEVMASRGKFHQTGGLRCQFSAAGSRKRGSWERNVVLLLPISRPVIVVFLNANHDELRSTKELFLT